MRQVPQLPQNFLNHSDRWTIIQLIFCFCGFWIPQPVPQLTFAKPPLPSDFDGWDLSAFRPQADCPGCDAQPFSNGCGRKKRFTIEQQFFHLSANLGASCEVRMATWNLRR